MNENGLSPLHILAGKPNAFRSSSCLGVFDLMLYDCKDDTFIILAAFSMQALFIIFVLKTVLFYLQGLSVDELREERYEYSKNWGADSTAKFPENYRTCINFFRFIWTSLRILSGLLSMPI